jgi:hypothetical protein
MKKYSLVVEADNLDNLKSLVEEKAKDATGTLGPPGSEKSIYRVTVTFYQKKDRWLNSDPSIPRQDWGIDLDNLLKPVFDGLGPIIGYRKDWTGGREHSGVLDSNIVEVLAKKTNSGSDKDFLGIEVELLHESESTEQ